MYLPLQQNPDKEKTVFRKNLYKLYYAYWIWGLTLTKNLVFLRLQLGSPNLLQYSKFPSIKLWVVFVGHFPCFIRMIPLFTVHKHQNNCFSKDRLLDPSYVFQNHIIHEKKTSTKGTVILKRLCSLFEGYFVSFLFANIFFLTKLLVKHIQYVWGEWFSICKHLVVAGILWCRHMISPF